MAVFPYVEAEPVGRRASWPDDLLATVARAIAEIHQSTTSFADHVLVAETFDLWYGEPLDEVLGALEALGSKATLVQRDALETVRSKFIELSAAIQGYQKIREVLLQQPHELVLSHTDLNGDNILCGYDGRVYIVDWDNLRLAPPECDIRYLLDIRRLELALSAYEEIRGPRYFNANALVFYLYRFALGDLAYFLCRILRPDRTDEEVARDLEVLKEIYAYATGSELPERIDQVNEIIAARA